MNMTGVKSLLGRITDISAEIPDKHPEVQLLVGIPVHELIKRLTLLIATVTIDRRVDEWKLQDLARISCRYRSDSEQKEQAVEADAASLRLMIRTALQKRLEEARVSMSSSSLSWPRTKTTPTKGTLPESMSGYTFPTMIGARPDWKWESSIARIG